MKVFLCFAFEKGELQRGHLSPDKESRELFAKWRGETLIISVTDKRCCWCPPAHPEPCPSSSWVAPVPPWASPSSSLISSCARWTCGALGEGTGVMDVPRGMRVPSMGAPTWLEGQHGVPHCCPHYASTAHPVPAPPECSCGLRADMVDTRWG